MLASALAGLVPALVSPALPQSQFSYVHGGVVNRVVSTDDDKVWTTHTGGVIRYSTNGVDFSNADVPESVRRSLRGIQISSDTAGPFAYCVGDDGVVLFSTDEGQSWTLKPQVLNQFGQPATLWDVYFEDRDHGWIVGYDHTLHETDQGGALGSWTNLAPAGHIAADNPEWYQIHPLGPDEWIAIADNGWTIRHLPGGAMPHSQIFLSQSCYAPEASDPPFDLELWSVDFVGDTGLIAGGVVHNDGYVWASTDRGATWDLHSACYDYLDPAAAGSTPPTFYGVEMFGNPTGGAVVGYGSAAFLAGTSSTASSPGACPSCPPGSLAWTQVVSDSDANTIAEPEDDGGQPFSRDIASSDSHQVAWLVGDFGHVRRSDDGGATWQEMQGLHRGRVSGGEFDDMQTGCIFGQAWTGYWTTDGGQNLTLEYAPTVPIDPNTGEEYFGYFNAAVVTPGASHAVVVGDRGRIAVRDPSGSWTDRSIGPWSDPLPLRSVLASNDAQIILTAGDAGSLWLSGNGGASFVQSTLQLGANPVSAAIVDMALVGSTLLYLAADQKLYAADVSNPSRALAAFPLVGSSATPTVLGVRSLADLWAGNQAGEVFRFDSGTGTFLPVAGVTPADLGGYVTEIEPVPASAEWFFGGNDGMAMHYDGSAWTSVKTTFEKTVNSFEFFSTTQGLVVGRKSSIGIWTP